jgi:hypothetical protein
VGPLRTLQESGTEEIGGRPTNTILERGDPAAGKTLRPILRRELKQLRDLLPHVGDRVFSAVLMNHEKRAHNRLEVRNGDRRTL